MVTAVQGEAVVIAKNLANASFTNNGFAKGATVVGLFGSVLVVNNTVVGNSVIGGDGGGLHVITQDDGARIAVANNILWANSASGGSVCMAGCNDLLVQDDADSNDVGSVINIFNNNFSDFFVECNPTLGCVSNLQIDLTTNLNNVDDDGNDLTDCAGAIACLDNAGGGGAVTSSSTCSLAKAGPGSLAGSLLLLPLLWAAVLRRRRSGY